MSCHPIKTDWSKKFKKCHESRSLASDIPDTLSTLQVELAVPVVNTKAPPTPLHLQVNLKKLQVLWNGLNWMLNVGLFMQSQFRSLYPRGLGISWDNCPLQMQTNNFKIYQTYTLGGAITNHGISLMNERWSSALHN